MKLTSSRVRLMFFLIYIVTVSVIVVSTSELHMYHIITIFVIILVPNIFRLFTYLNRIRL